MRFFISIRLKKIAQLFLILFGSANNLWSDHANNHLTGLKPMSEEQIQGIKQSWSQIIGVRPTQLGLDRINTYANKMGLLLDNTLSPANYKNEFIKIQYGKSQPKLLPSQKFTLPSSVNNSLLPSFPNIGDQGAEGSCVAFAATYYQGTHELGLANGYDNKDDQATVLSPRWTYNMINFGNDGGSWPNDAYTLMARNGAPSIIQTPYQAGNYLFWDLNTQHWIDAISNRTSEASYISNLNDPSSSAISLIKETLNNGHVVTFATYFYSWVFTQVKNDPSDSSDDSHVGELAASYMNGYWGGHFVTIVGYDDNVWIDVNNNNQVDPGEKGAFLVANSWGSSWGNNGFVWISYDAFYSASQVPNGPTDRVPAAGAMGNLAVSISSKAPYYTPSLYAEFTVNQVRRNEIAIGGGISTTDQTTPTATFNSGAIANQGGSLRFDGSNSSDPLPATFALDLSDLLEAGISENQRFWLTTSDVAGGSPTTISSYSLVDTVHGKSISKDTDLPAVFDNARSELYIDYTFNDDPGPDMPPTVQFYFPPDGAVIRGELLISVVAIDDKQVSLVEIFVDNYLCSLQTVSPYTASVDTTKLTNGSHTLKAVTYDNSNNVTVNSITITVEN